MIKIEAPAKINLTLEVLARREDGYHDISSILQTISLCDTLSFKQADEIKITGDAPGWQASKSLVSKAAALIKEATGCPKGAAINVVKRIPLLSGLGGDSSDAAATLKGLNKLWELHLTPWRLAEIGSELGSDVPYFVLGGTAEVGGRGDALTLLPPLPRMWVVLVEPPLERETGKTGQMYKTLGAELFTDGHFTEEVREVINRQCRPQSSILHNAFESVADESFLGLEQCRWQFLEAGAYDIHLAGSGPTLFSLFKEKREAEEILRKLKEKGSGAYLAHTM